VETSLAANGNGLGTNLAGTKILLVEDEFIITLEMELALLNLGCVVLGPAASAAQALALLDRERPDVAMLDVRLLDGLVTPVAERLGALGVPFVLVTAYDTAQLPPPLRAAPLLAKPVNDNELRRLLSRLLGSP